MTNVLLLGANGSIARVATNLFLKETDAQLTLYLRNSFRIRNIHPSRVRVFEGDVLDSEKLTEAMVGQDVVYANLAGSCGSNEYNWGKAFDLDQLNGNL